MRLRGLIVALFLTFVVAASPTVPAQVRSGSPETATTAASPSSRNSASSDSRGGGPTDAGAFSSSVESLRAASAAAKKDKEAEATVLLNEERISLDAEGRITDAFHFI